MTQDEQDTAIGRFIREGIAQGLPLQMDREPKVYFTVELVGLGTVQVSVEICRTEIQH